MVVKSNIMAEGDGLTELEKTEKLQRERGI